MSTRFREIVAISTPALLLGAFLLWSNLRRSKGAVSKASAQENESEEVSTKILPRFRVFFGSQTGTSESFANDLVAEAVSDFGFECIEAVSVEMFTPSVVEEGANLIFLLSTYGEGDPSDDAIQFNEWLKTSSIDLTGVSYAIFGLGNKQYAHYNEMGKRTDKGFQQLGASRICPTGFGDDNVDIEQDWEDWKKVFWQYFMEKNNLIRNQVIRNPMDKILLNIHISSKRSQLPFDATVTQGGTDLVSKFFFGSNIVPVISKLDLCIGKVQLDLDISKVPSLKYRTGDVLDVLPLNRVEDVEWVLNEYGLNGTDMMTFTRKKNCGKITVKKPFPTPCSVHTLVSRYLDLSGIPSRSFLREIAILTNQNESNFVDTYKSSSTISVLKNVTIEFPTLIQLIGKQKSRAYSICSSPSVDKKNISLLVSKLDDLALASSWLVDRVVPKDSNSLLHVSLRPGVFRLPPLPLQPVIMICVGTGFAPFRAFLAELQGSTRRAALFFGCRNKEEWIYEKEMTEFHGEFFLATSREGGKEYVQDLVKEQIELVKQLMALNGVIYVCGSTGMGLGVMKTLQKYFDMDQLKERKKYIEEVW